MSEWPIIVFNESHRNWKTSYDVACELEPLFPGQDIGHFVSACSNNDWGPLVDRSLVRFLMIEEGERDGANWEWVLTLDDGTSWRVVAGCDYTGWDCRSWINWEQL